MEQLESILLSEKVTDRNLEGQVKLCQFCEDIIDDYKTILEIAVKHKKLNKKEFQFLKKLTECHAELSDRIIYFAENTNGYSVVQLY
jgi:sulfur transfer protein SufE